MNKKFLYAHVSLKNGCYQHRVIWPYKYMAKYFPELTLDLSMTDPVGEYQNYLTHGNPPLSDFTYIGKWKRSGGKWILSIDDDYFNIPSWSTAHMTEDQKDLFYAAYELADTILVSTPELARTVNKPHKTITARNLMQVNDYGVDTVAPTLTHEPLRILWSGSTTHVGDFVDVEPAINEILKKYHGKVEFLFMGYCPGNLLRDWYGNGVHYEAGVPLSVYPKILNRMRPHITLAPIDYNNFNKCKSNIRVLEGWSLASAVVASDFGEYAVVRDGVDGLKVNTSEEWFVAIDRLIADKDLRETLAKNGREEVAARWSWENPNCHSEWINVVNNFRYS